MIAHFVLCPHPALAVLYRTHQGMKKLSACVTDAVYALPGLVQRPKMTPGLRNRARLQQLVCGIPNTKMTTLGQIGAQSIRDQVYKKLEQAIVDGTLRPNAVLSDRHLSEELGVSRTPIRDALHILESSGLVQRRGRIGWVVAGISLQDVEELFDLRCLLEPAGISKIVQWDEEPLQKLTSSFDEFTPDLDSSQVPRYLERDDAFHKALCEASENSRLVHVYGVMERQIHRIRHGVSYRYQGRVSQSLAEHRAICAALAGRNEQTARQALIAHIRTAKDKYIELYAQLLEEHPDASP